MDILRFTTAGNIDDGKSTLIGRLLYDTKNIKTDILDSVSEKGGRNINLAFLTDGLRSERAQGITIDVAYKYFTTTKRKYIITDAPGHFQYTKNLVTGASGVDAIIILIDAEHGITDQTIRHSLVASFLRVPGLVVAINKMDLIAYDQYSFNGIKGKFMQIARQLQMQDVSFIPISALNGDNVSFRSEKMDWYKGGTLLEYLENCNPIDHLQDDKLRFSIQYIQGGFCYGNLISGTIAAGDTVMIHPSGRTTTVEKIYRGYSGVNCATDRGNLCLCLNNTSEIQRGDILSTPGNLPNCNDEFECEICWLDSAAPLEINKEYFIRHNAIEIPGTVTGIISKTNVETLEQIENEPVVTVNEFAKILVQLKGNLIYDPFSVIREMGRGIIIDPITNNTSAAFIIT